MSILPPGNKKTILVVEDEPPILKVISLKLAGEGFAVLKAKDGQEGLNLALNKHPDLILLDILLPEINGMEVMKRIREDAWGKKVPIIILTNLAADDETTKQIVKDQPSYYLVKADWKLEDVVKKIRETLCMV